MIDAVMQASRLSSRARVRVETQTIPDVPSGAEDTWAAMARKENTHVD
ncbi:hypothetical protein LG315_07920 [Microbacterium marinum]